MKTPSRKQLANALVAKRKTLNIGMREAAKAVGVSVSTYSRIEAAKPMTLETYARAVEWAGEYLDD